MRRDPAAGTLGYLLYAGHCAAVAVFVGLIDTASPVFWLAASGALVFGAVVAMRLSASAARAIDERRVLRGVERIESGERARTAGALAIAAHEPGGALSEPDA